MSKVPSLPSSTKVLVFASQKGGSGKTTLSGHIAVAAEQAGAGPVALVDADPQGSLAKWWNARKADTPAFAETSVPTLSHDLDMLKRSGIRLIVIDTPPSVTNQITEIISHADLVVVPTRPSPHDLRAVGLTVDLIEHQRKPLIFVINSATARARITSDTAVTLSQHGTVAPVMIHHRVDFAASMIDGRTVGEIDPKSRSAKEVSMLWAYIEARLDRAAIEKGEAMPRIERGFERELLTPLRSAADPQPPPRPAQASTATRSPVRARALETVASGAFLSAPVIETELHSHDFPPASAAPPTEADGATDARPWHGVERRYADRGPPAGAQERRHVPTFGRRTTS